MTTLMNINPWSFLDDILNADSHLFKSVRDRAAGRFPPVNAFLDDNAILIEVELPGKAAGDIDLSLEPQAVTISDKPAEEGKDPAWRRRLELPFRVNADKANAKFTDGILKIELPKADTTGARRIAIAE